MTKSLSICVLLLIAGCGGMNNDEIIAETKKCEAAGMDAVHLARMWDYRVVIVQCAPKDKP